MSDLCSNNYLAIATDAEFTSYHLHTIAISGGAI